MPDVIYVKRQAQVGELVLNRAAKLNALNVPLLRQFTELMVQIKQDQALRVLVLRGAGRLFCGGADLAAVEEGTLDDASRLLSHLLHEFSQLPLATIAKVTGGAYGGGIGLLCCCDCVIAAQNTRFAFGELKLGLVPAIILPYVLATMGARQARRYCLSAETFDSSIALHLNLVHEVVADDALDGVIERQIQYFLHTAPQAFRQVKTLIQQSHAPSQEEREACVRLSSTLWRGDEAQAGIQAFFDQCLPPWVPSS